jgi:hypothetical protein
MKTKHMDQNLRVVTEIELQPHNMNKEDGFSVSRAWKHLIHDLKEWRPSHTEVSALSNGPWKGLTSILHSPHHHHPPSPLLMPTWSLLIGPSQFLPHSSPLAPFPQTSLLQPYMYSIHSPGSSLQPWRWRQHASPNCWLLPTNPQSNSTQNNTIRT